MTLIQTWSDHVSKLIPKGIRRMVTSSNENLRNGDLYSQSQKNADDLFDKLGTELVNILQGIKTVIFEVIFSTRQK